MAAALCLLLLAGGEARSRRKANAGGGEPGVFDFYLLSLSWSPEYCAGSAGGRDSGQCGEGRRFGFVVHGLWPQFERGWPEDCGGSQQVSQRILDHMLPLMPSPRLIEHEWSKHGTCSGLSQQDYFATLERAYGSVNIPREYQSPGRQVYAKPADLLRNFAAANRALPPEAFRVLCGGRYLSEVRVCLTRDLKGRACSAGVRDTCRADEIILRPVR